MYLQMSSSSTNVDTLMGDLVLNHRLYADKAGLIGLNLSELQTLAAVMNNYCHNMGVINPYYMGVNPYYNNQL